MDNIMLKIDNVSKQYKLGQIGGTTLRDELQRMRAKRRGEEDPTKRIGAKEYKSGETFMALDRVSFEVKKGERIGIIGHNGAGKSTLLKLISRVTAPTAGMIGLNGRVASMLEVGTGFHPELTGRENIYMNGAILGMTRKEIDGKMEDIIDFSEVRDFIDTPVKRYSSGMFVKLAFSVAAHLDSEILIMDEVLAVGDMAFQKKCINKMLEVAEQEGRTVLYVSHNMNTIRQLCDRCVVLKQGRIIYQGDVEESIKYYYNNEIVDSVFLDYTNIPRLRWLNNTSVRTLSANYIGKDNITFLDNEKMKIKLRWINERDVCDLSLRIEILRPDRTPIGTTFLYDFYTGEKNKEGSVCVELDTSTLVAGQYTMNYTFFYANDLGGNTNADCVHGLYFNKVSTSRVTWQRKNWGNVMFPPLITDSVNIR